MVEAERHWLRQMDEIHRAQRTRHLELDVRIAAYEPAARMQIEAADALYLLQRSARTKRGIRPRSRGDAFLLHALPDGQQGRGAFHRVPDL